ncbi:helix-turn-helix domain-containing protein [Clostridium sp.]|uniref:winged helix-turn-helix transcriptional regulator n=1 Tax=Clostridium sp. TaxID=1506 RepID=UPI002A91BD2F|nr:helix-turn-helix domain-containing protein [Clostridium sp.]MDY6012801.1 helix-turn-helix domain-containing protein [Clostridium sp.]
MATEVDMNPVEYTLSIISNKWKILIIYWLLRNEVMRYSELKRSLNGVTHKMLSLGLKQLEQDNIITRKQYDQIPPKVEYRISSKGRSLAPIISALCNWGTDNMQ